MKTYTCTLFYCLLHMKKNFFFQFYKSDYVININFFFSREIRSEHKTNELNYLNSILMFNYSFTPS